MHKKIFSYICILLVIGIGFFGDIIPKDSHDNLFLSSVSSDMNVFAADDCSGPNPPVPCLNASSATQDAAIKEMLNELIAGLNIALGILTIIVSPAIMLAGWLMSPDWTSGDLFGIRPVIHSLWVTVSNITYFIYAILLIFIALATIFNSDNYGYKQLLPKLALGIILVPLSWWFIQFTISLSSLVTASVMNIPTETLTLYSDQKTGGKADWWNTPSIPKNIDYTNGPTGLEKQIDGADCSKGCVSPKDIVSSAAGIYSPLLVYGYGIFKFSTVKELSSTTDVVTGVLQLINNGFLSVIMFLVFGLLVIALIFMLMVRAIKLWFYAIFSPLMTLKFVLGDKIFKAGGNGGDNSFDIKEFIGLAFVPAIVGLSLSFGLVIVALLQSSSIPNQTYCDPSAMQPGGPGCTIIRIMGNDANKIVQKVEEVPTTSGGKTYRSVNEVMFGNITYRFVGSTNVDPAKVAAGANSTSSALSSAGGIFGTIIIDIIALIFIWVAFMAAKTVNITVGRVMEPFEAMGKKVGGLAMSAPKYLPVLPGGLGGSMAGVGKVLQNAENKMVQNSEDRFKSSSASKLFGGKDMVSTADEKRMEQYLANASNASHGAWEDAGKLIGNQGGKTVEYSSLLKDLVEKLKGMGYQDQLTALKKAGYSDDAANKIAERLKDNGGVYNKNDSTLMNALKSRIGSSGSDASKTNTNALSVKVSGGGKFSFNSDGFDLDKESKENILKALNAAPQKLIGISEEVLRKELKGTMGVSEDEVKSLLEKIKKAKEDQQKTTPPPSSTPPAGTQTPPNPKP